MTADIAGPVRVLHSEADLPRKHPAHRKFGQLNLPRGYADTFSPSGLVIYTSFTWVETGKVVSFMSASLSGGGMVAMRLCPCVAHRTSASGFTFIEYLPDGAGPCGERCVFKNDPLYVVWTHPAFAERPWEEVLSDAFPEFDILAAMVTIPSLAVSLQKIYQARFMRTGIKGGGRAWLDLLDRCSGILTR